MAKNSEGNNKKLFRRLGEKRTTIGSGRWATSKMSKHQRRNHKPYKGQGRP